MSEYGSLTDEYPRRIQRMRALMEEHRIDALLLLTGPNLVYFTGMPCGRSGSRPYFYLLSRKATPILIVHTGRQYEARAFTDVEDVRTYTQLSRIPIDTILGAIDDLDLRGERIGLELGAEMVMDLPYGEFLILQEALPKAEFLDASPLLWQMRMIKSEAEIARVAKACDISMEAYDRTFKAIRSGMSEAEIEKLMIYHMLEQGGESPWVLITSGAGNYDLVSKGGCSRRVAPGDMVWMDCGCAVDGYFSDFGRAGVLGGPTKEQEEAQREVHRVTHMAIDMMQPGTPVAEIAARCNEAVRELRLPITTNISELAGRVGHGLGMVVTELPSLMEEDTTLLMEGMIVTIEPGVATDFGTFHIEENVLITKEGSRVLSEGNWQLWTI